MQPETKAHASAFVTQELTRGDYTLTLQARVRAGDTQAVIYSGGLPLYVTSLDYENWDVEFHPDFEDRLERGNRGAEYTLATLQFVTGELPDELYEAWRADPSQALLDEIMEAGEGHEFVFWLGSLTEGLAFAAGCRAGHGGL